MQSSVVVKSQTDSSLDSLQRRLTELKEYVHFVESCSSHACQFVSQRTSEECDQLSLELESGGNIKFTRGDQSMAWYRTCCDLIHSRFSVNCAAHKVRSFLRTLSVCAAWNVCVCKNHCH